MKYFYDTEFIEDGRTIDLISIGIVAEDGREYYAISTEFNRVKASQWVRDNVLNQLPERYPVQDSSPRIQQLSLLYKTRKRIKEDILEFIGNDKPEFWAYYADYDHVALCQLFGKMIDLPKGWPMYTNDLKQLCYSMGNPTLSKTVNEHSAIEDARWLRNMYYVLTTETI